MLFTHTASFPEDAVTRYNEEITRHAAIWSKKTLLRRVYSDLHREMLVYLNGSDAGLVVEIGSGIGALKEALPDCVLTDLFPNPWLDRVENCYSLTFSDETIDNLILFDVWHHLEFPGDALAEFQRVLTKNGRLIICDPAMGVLGLFVFGCFHREPLELLREITWVRSGMAGPVEMRYYAAQGNASRVFSSRTFADKLKGWRVLDIRYLSCLAYLGSGGFEGPQLYPLSLYIFFKRVDSYLSRIPLFASRMIVALEKQV